MVDTGGEPRPFLDTLATLSQALPEGARYVPPLQPDPSLAVAAFATDDRVVVGMANPSATPRNRTVGFQHAEVLSVDEVSVSGGDPFPWVDGFDSLSGLVYGPGIWQDTASPEYFGDDSARLGGAAGSWIILGEGTPIRSIELVAWRWSGIDTGSLLVEGSADGTTWSAIDVEEALEAGSWDRVLWSVPDLSDAVAWVRLTWPTIDPEWALELGSASLEMSPGSAITPPKGALGPPSVLTVEVPAESAIVLTLQR